MYQITVEIDEDSNDIRWTTDMAGPIALSVMAQTIFDMYEYYFESPARPMLEGNPVRVCIEMKEDTLGISYRPEADAARALGVVQAALCGLYREMHKEGFDPLLGVLGAHNLEFDLKSKSRHGVGGG